ncbi:MAG: glycerol-3-phosphate 1-O-acyltransferase PlsY [Puniceicoccaceae bacterium]
MLAYPLSLIIGYLVGSISFAVLICRAKGVNIFEVGSGNPGATNVLRSLGKPFGYGCFLLDALKGIISVIVGKYLALQFGADPLAVGIVGLFGSIIGHSFSCFLGFKGGKGVATTVGGMLALLPEVMLIGIVLWLIVFFIFKYVSLASIVLGISLPISAYFLNEPPLSLGLCGVLALLILVRHKSNIQRLLAGTENRAGKKKS